MQLLQVALHNEESRVPAAACLELQQRVAVLWQCLCHQLTYRVPHAWFTIMMLLVSCCLVALDSQSYPSLYDSEQSASMLMICLAHMDGSFD
jgi:hypothetical protein